MLPTDILNIIDTYHQDLGILTELQKLRHVNWEVNNSGDVYFKAQMLTVFMRTGILTGPQLREIIDRSKQRFGRTPAGWVMHKIESMERQRMRLWACTENYFPFCDKFKRKFALFSTELQTHDLLSLVIP